MNIIIGLILIALGVYFLFFMRSKNSNDLLEIQAQETKTIPEVREALEAMADYDPNYRELVELKGFAQSAQPVQTPFSHQQVAFYTAETLQVSESTEEYTDNQGNRRTRTRKHEDRIGSEESGTEFLLRDNSGNEVVIETNGVADKFDMPKTLDRFDRDNPYRSGGYYENPFRHYHHFDVAPRGMGYRVLGYKQVEKTIPLNAPLYLLGEAYLLNGRIYLGQPRDSKKSYIVTTKSEEQLLKSKKNSQTMAIVAGIVCAIVGIVVMVSGF